MHTHAHAHTRMHAHTHAHTRMHTHTHARTHTRMHTHAHAHEGSHTKSRTHAYTRTKGREGVVKGRELETPQSKPVQRGEGGDSTNETKREGGRGGFIPLEREFGQRGEMAHKSGLKGECLLNYF